MFNNNTKNILSWIGIFISIVILFNGFSDSNVTKHNIKYSEFVNKIKTKEISAIKIKDRNVEGRTNENIIYKTYGIHDFAFLQYIKDYDVEITIEPLTTGMSIVFDIVLSMIPSILSIGILLYIFRSSKGGGFGFDINAGKMISKSFSKEKFKDIGGLHEPKKELREIVDFFQNTQKYNDIGAEVPKGILLVGSPGNGKTLLVRALAGESNVPFFVAHGSSFVEVFAGMGAKKVRGLFEEAKKNSPCIIFIDEIDAIGSKRGSSAGSSDSERVQTLNEILTSMDGFDTNNGIIVIGATNRVDVLDNALLRAGRFDRKVHIHNPSFKERTEIASVYLNKTKHDIDVTPEKVAQLTIGMASASIKLMINEAAIFAIRNKKTFIALRNLDEANDKLRLGMSSSLDLQDKKILVAYHEAGHALLSICCENSDPIHKATINPTGGAAGFVLRVPKKDKFMRTFDELLSDIVVACAGRAAEELIFGPSSITVGASSDIQQATNIAKSMITEYGMDDKIGFINIGLKNKGMFVDRDISNKTLETLDNSIKNIIDKCYATAMQKLIEYQNELSIIAKALIQNDILLGEEIEKLCQNVKKVTAYEMIFKKKNISLKIPEDIKELNKNNRSK